MSNPLYELTKILRAVGDSNPEAGFGTVASEASGIPFRETRFLILRLLDESVDSFLHTGLDDHRTSDMIEHVNQFKNKFIHHAALQNCGEVKKHLQLQVYIPLFDAFGDTISAVTKLDLEPLDRDDLQQRTEQLLDEIENAKLPEYAKSVLTLKLFALRRILDECSYYSDGEIRRRVKVVYADYCAEFRRHDKEYETLSEKMYNWAKMTCGAGIFALALTADASAVAGLLEGPPAALPKE